MKSTEGRMVRFGAMELRFLVDETDGKGEMVVFEMAVQPDARVPAAHHHEAVDECVYGLAGTMTTTLDGVAHEIRPGDSLFIPRGRVHHHANRHGEPAKALIVLTPGSIGRRYFEDMLAVVKAPGKPDMARVAEVMRRHGLVPA
jgi:quercetin dioxygenase-like cupin family protein